MPLSPFEQHLAATDLPSSGPELFHARRALWREPAQNPPEATQPNPSRRRLENIMAAPGALENDETWGAGIDRVWNGLVGGARLKHRLPLALVIKILQAGWIREGTWPRGAAAPDTDDALDQAAGPSTTETTPTVTTPGSTYGFNMFDGREKMAS
ncbi:hypothetical protein TRAPUB_64 [Trametes pubescens]|uniref:DUF4050 domain-containing protein n=1 Tax=Trametes pubescens TaxID=154538 RepID=A0A1M2VN66_TRAPU|nr:hypothetical protein TRAPUB_64 [Trametes pubescens]